MSKDEIIEVAIQGHASTRDAIRWAMQQEREACAKVCEDMWVPEEGVYHWIPDSRGALQNAAEAIRARSEK